MWTEPETLSIVLLGREIEDLRKRGSHIAARYSRRLAVIAESYSSRDARVLRLEGLSSIAVNEIAASPFLKAAAARRCELAKEPMPDSAPSRRPG